MANAKENIDVKEENLGLKIRTNSCPFLSFCLVTRTAFSQATGSCYMVTLCVRYDSE